LAFFSADVDPGFLFGLMRPDVLEFLGPDQDEEDPNDAAWVRVTDDRPTSELGVEYVAGHELALVYTAARALAEIEADNADLQAAIGVLAETLIGDDAGAGEAEPTLDHEIDQHADAAVLTRLQEAARTRHRVQIVYSRSWDAGVRTREIEPYRLISTKRGWEVDAGVDRGAAAGGLRTFLVTNIRQVEVLDQTFEPPADLSDLIAEHRRTTSVRVRIPYSAWWAADMHAEQVARVSEDDDQVTLDLELLPPVRRRMGLIALAADGAAQVVSPVELTDAGRELTAELLRHHRQSH